jgi:hypothetical protein
MIEDTQVTTPAEPGTALSKVLQNCEVDLLIETGVRSEEQAIQLHNWVSSASTSGQPARATVEQIEKALGFMTSSLPGKATDADTGRKRVAVYVRLLQDFTPEAIKYLTEVSIRTLEWFPTPRQCLTILESFNDHHANRLHKARTALRAFTDGQFQIFTGRLEAGEVPQSWLDEQPEQWCRIAVERGLLRRLDDGSFIQRKAAIRPLLTSEAA